MVESSFTDSPSGHSRPKSAGSPSWVLPGAAASAGGGASTPKGVVSTIGSAEAGTDLEPHAAADRIGLREDVPDDEFPVVLAFGVLLQLRVFDLESTEVRGEAANRERAVLAADGTQRELAGDDDGRNRFLGSRWGCHDGSPDDE